MSAKTDGLAAMRKGPSNKIRREGKLYGKWLCCAVHPYYRDHSGCRCWICRDVNTGDYHLVSAAKLRHAKELKCASQSKPRAAE